ncbi:hypothetical protein CYMTET_30799 [Cymbomonas tetramitiformis]|uniref:DDE-1 domain-containing protein n=1 Tax=Cymbomonas tetramitiformis TaxID=36881 RepID=A0AAE0FI47_9CHLO|nr:hypothetical protein CYMTET_30799 [Cymbomonas tetramitiformis]
MDTAPDAANDDVDLAGSDAPRAKLHPAKPPVDWHIKSKLTVLPSGTVRVEFSLRAKKLASGQPKRQAYTPAKKLKVIDKFHFLRDEAYPTPTDGAARINNMNQSLVSKWAKDEKRLRERAKGGGWYSLRRAYFVRGRFPQLERALFKEYSVARAKGLRIGRRCKSNQKTLSTEERLPRIKRWHARLKRRLKDRSGDVQLHPKRGHYLPENRYNVDQVPIPFVMQSSRTYEQKGSGRVWVAGTKNADDKRFCTLMCTVRMIGLDANGHHQQPKQTICFRGTGARISQAEKDAYDKRVIVRWQPKAYYDQALCAEWRLLDFQVDAGSKKVLFCDNLHGHTTDAFAAALENSNTERHLLPTEVTDEINVVDQGVGAEVKRECGVVQDEYLALLPDNLEKWTSGFNVCQRRVLITEWVGMAPQMTL